MQSAMRVLIVLALPAIVIAGVPEVVPPPPLRFSFWYVEDPWWSELLELLATLVLAGLAALVVALVVAVVVAVVNQFRFTP